MVKFTSRAATREVVVAANLQEYQSLGLSQILEHLQKQPRPVVLDLGAASGAKISFLSQYGCKVYVEHLAASLHSLIITDLESDEVKPDVAEVLQKYADGTQFDVIFAWDLFNYMKVNVLTDLITSLSNYCNNNTLMYALVSGGKTISTEPMNFVFLDASHLRYQSRTDSQMPSPGFSQMDFRKKFPNLVVLKTYLLRNGMQEYMFRFGGS